MSITICTSVHVLSTFTKVANVFAGTVKYFLMCWQVQQTIFSRYKEVAIRTKNGYRILPKTGQYKLILVLARSEMSMFNGNKRKHDQYYFFYF